VRRERGFPVVAQPLGHDIAVLDPDVEQGAVPGLGRLDVVIDYADRVVHDPESKPAPTCPASRRHGTRSTG
jgi:hypothetical protein